MLIVWIIIFSLLGSVGSVSGAALILVFPEGVRRILSPCLVSYAAGTLLGAAFLGMIPHALEYSQPRSILSLVLAGIIIFFLLEKLVIWRHCHVEGCEVHNSAGPLILVGDAFHNFVDGAVITAAFLTSFPLGVATALAVIAHEIPQEIGDFVILLESGYSRHKAFFYNILSSITTLPGAVIAYFFLKSMEAVVPYILAFSAASFIYIATADLIPKLNQKIGIQASIRQFILLLAGVGTIILFHVQHG
ncbi:MAG: ZIP family metal transporter [Planctomycetia bacterium]|nr:MAG: ZIP family metal transporter [Planctomycetia bacterium]TVL96187.1 MAG: ZIP zinc transporter [Candidatus Brocadia sp. BL1]HQU31023.1 ZIP family metal transporter [Candidatus Brocadia sapporoensis]